MAWFELAPSGVYKVVFHFEGRKLKLKAANSSGP